MMSIPDLRAQIAAIRDYVDWCGAVHDDDCPQDDTCDCSGKPINDGVNSAVRFLEALADAEGAASSRLLVIAGLVNAYHNDDTTLTAAETLRAIAEALGPALQREGAAAERKGEP